MKGGDELIASMDDQHAEPSIPPCVRVVVAAAAVLLALVFYWLGYHPTVYDSNEFQEYPHQLHGFDGAVPSTSLW